MRTSRVGIAVLLLLALFGGSTRLNALAPGPGPQSQRQRGLLEQSPEEEEGQQFSRARWIREHRLPYPGAPTVATEAVAPPPVPPDFFLLSTADAFVDADVTSPVRVNNDLLPPGNATNPWSQAEPDIDVNPENDDNIVAVYQESRFRDGGARALNFSTSFDGGLTWTEGSLPHLTQELGGPWERASDPWVAFGPGNRVYYVSLDFNETNPANQIGVSVSTDGGLSWGPPVTVFGSDLDFNDKEAIEVDTHPASSFYGNVYVAWDVNIAQGQGFAAQHLLVARSVDGGASYRAPLLLRAAGSNDTCANLSTSIPSPCGYIMNSSGCGLPAARPPVSSS